MGDSKIDERREQHSRLGVVRISDLVMNGYLACALLVVVSAIAAIVSHFGMTLPFIETRELFLVALLPIGLAHVMLWVNSSTLYNHYFLVWDERTRQQIASLLLWLLHLLALVASVMYPQVWTLTVPVLASGVLLKNLFMLVTQPSASPARKVIDAWIPRTVGYVGVSIVFGVVFTIFSTDGFYARVLGVDASNPDVKRVIEFNQQFASWVAVVFVGLGTVTRVELLERYPRRTYETYEQEMEAYLTNAK